jgi:hypothetical protein
MTARGNLASGQLWSFQESATGNSHPGPFPFREPAGTIAAAPLLSYGILSAGATSTKGPFPFRVNTQVATARSNLLGRYK